MQTARIKSEQPLRSGLTSIEVLVAFTLLATIIGLSTPMVVANRRLLKAQRNYRLALEELSNQLDQLASQPVEELGESLERLMPSEFASAHLPDAKISGESRPSDFGTRISLQISWAEANRHSAPLKMSAWSTSPTKIERKDRP